jgi:NAD(P)-dependent dehydrogenase (short-subunit alcohol dehydrogenase family)
LPGRRALVTGAAQGIGRAVAVGLASDGLDVAVAYRTSAADAERTADLVRVKGCRAVTLAADVTDAAAAASLVAAAERHLGGVDVLVNVVGDYDRAPLDEVTAETWREMLDSNLTSVFYLCRAALPGMRARRFGRIVNFGFAGVLRHGWSERAIPYKLAKAGVVLLTRALARAEAKNGVTVNVVSPGVAENSVSKPVEEIPAGRLATVEEVAAAVRYFASDAAAYVTGQDLEVAGGWNL